MDKKIKNKSTSGKIKKAQKNRHKKAIILLTVVAVFLAAIVTVICVWPKAPLKSYAQTINTEESIEKINNPDQGFYRPTYVKVTEEGISYNKNIVTNSTQLYHLRVDISLFSKAVNGNSDKPLTSAALNGLNDMLTFLKQKNKNAIIRFAYAPSFGNAKDQEPEQAVINQHIKQVCGVLNKYQTTITAIEAGLIGPWGEMHSSKIANAEHINQIIEHFLANTTNLPILVRTPKMIYNYLGITINNIETYKINAGDKAYRLGIYNDGYLGSDSDLGTYTNREKEIEFLSQLTNHLPYGGEIVVPNSSLHNIENCLPEMNKINLNYLNIEWNNAVIDKWKNTTYTAECGNHANYYGQSAFTYIENHMGYRFVLTESVFEYSTNFNKLNVKLKINNVGFGNLNKTKLAKLIFVNQNGEVKFDKQVGNFSGEQEVNYSTKLNLENGSYQVYLCVYGEEDNSTPLYAMQFANSDIWNSNLQANKIGEINIQKS